MQQNRQPWPSKEQEQGRRWCRRMWRLLLIPLLSFLDLVWSRQRSIRTRRRLFPHPLRALLLFNVHPLKSLLLYSQTSLAAIPFLRGLESTSNFNLRKTSRNEGLGQNLGSYKLKRKVVKGFYSQKMKCVKPNHLEVRFLLFLRELEMVEYSFSIITE